MQLPEEERRETVKTQKIKAETPSALQFSKKEVDARTLHEALSKPAVSPQKTNKTMTDKNSMFKSHKHHSKFFETQKTVQKAPDEQEFPNNLCATV